MSSSIFRLERAGPEGEHTLDVLACSVCTGMVGAPGLQVSIHTACVQACSHLTAACISQLLPRDLELHYRSTDDLGHPTLDSEVKPV